MNFRTVHLPLAFLAFAILSTSSAPLRNVPQTLKQPDGRVIHCCASGDEFFNWLHDRNGNILLRDSVTGYLVYAVTDGSQLRPSARVVDDADTALMSLGTGARFSPTVMSRLRQDLPGGSAAHPDLILMAPKTGAINNIVVFIRFYGESESTEEISVMNSLFNATTPNANSMRNYFLEASYNQLTINTTFYPTPPGPTVVSFQDSHQRGYYLPFNAVSNPIGYHGGDNGNERLDREHSLLKNAVDAIGAEVPSGLDVDGDNDGNVDNVCFIVSGDPSGWASLLWPHMWSLYSVYAYIQGKRVYTYNFQLEGSLRTSGVGVLCHEMFHSLGAPDLYHYSYDGLNPVYTWDLMDYDLDPPQHMGAYMKVRYGNWITHIPEATVSGRYTLNPLRSSTQNCLKVRSPHSTAEYFVLEYRKRDGIFEGSLSSDGLLVYRINSVQDGYGNADGPPDEVYLYRPDGSPSVDGTPLDATFNLDAGRTLVDDWSNPFSFLANGSAGGLRVGCVGRIGGQIQFSIGGFAAADISWSSAGLATSNVQSVLTHSNGDWFAGVLQGGIYRSTDRGTGWSHVWANSTTVSALLTYNGNEIYAGTASGVYRSTDNGATWGLRGLSGNFIYHLASTRTGCLFAGTGGNIYRSTNAGSSWSQVQSVTDLRSIATDLQGNVFAGGIHDGQFWRSTDDGMTWTNPEGPSGGVFAVAVQRSGKIITGYFYFYQSTDGGEHFTAVSPPAPGTLVRSMIVDSIGIMYAGTISGIYRSTDDGHTWSSINSGLGNSSVWALANGLEGEILAATEAGVYLSAQGPLPVALTAFQATAVDTTHVRFEWTTVSEQNNYGFEIQESRDPVGGFVMIAGSFVQGHGTTILPHTYDRVLQVEHPYSKYFRIKQIDLDGTVMYYAPTRLSGVNDVGPGRVPATYTLEANYPNPFNPTTVISYQLPVVSDVRLEILDMLGRHVATLVDGLEQPGTHSVRFDARLTQPDKVALAGGGHGSGLASGMYVYRLAAGLFVQSRKMILAK